MIWIIIAVMLGIGIFALRGSIKNSFKNVESRNARSRLLRAILGEEGYRYFVGFVGACFIVVSLGLLFFMLGGGSLFRDKTDVMVIKIKSEDPLSQASKWATEDQLNTSYPFSGEREWHTYQHISLKNNYRSTLPDLIWKMRNLESIDLTNNDFTELPLHEFVKLPKLKLLILDGNPIDEAYLEQARSVLKGMEVVKNDIQKP